MVKDGLVIRRNDVNDKRLNLIFLTAKGKQIEKKVIAVVDDTTNKATNGLHDDQIVIICDAFQTVCDNIKVCIK